MSDVLLTLSYGVICLLLIALGLSVYQLDRQKKEDARLTQKYWAELQEQDAQMAAIFDCQARAIKALKDAWQREAWSAARKQDNCPGEHWYDPMTYLTFNDWQRKQ